MANWTQGSTSVINFFCALHPRLDRRAPPERSVLQRGFDGLFAGLSQARSSTELWRVLCEPLSALLQPKTLVLYSREGGEYRPLHAEGGAPRPDFAAQSALISVLLPPRAEPLATPRRKSRAALAQDPFERAALETLDVALIVPVRRNSELVAFLCLGAGPSGDGYPPGVVSLVAAAAERTGAQLRRLDEPGVYPRGVYPRGVCPRLAAEPEPSTTAPARTSERRLAALLSADAVGFSRLMADDEVATVRAIAASRELMRELVELHLGRVVDTVGDNMLAEFQSTLDASRCALEIQRRLASQDARRTAQRKMPFRIGLHMGDVIVDGDRIYGEGVNVAARLEGLAEPGGICVSEEVYRQVRRRHRESFEDLGECSLKNIPEPVRVYRVKLSSRVHEDVLECEVEADGGWVPERLITGMSTQQAG